MELKSLLGVMLKRWKLITVIALVVLAATAGVTLTATPQYRATTRVYVTVSSAGDLTDLVQGSGYAETQLASYAQFATSSRVLAPVIKDLGLDTSVAGLASTITVAVPQNTQFLDITAQSENPALAARISDAVGAQLVTVITDLAPKTSDVVKAQVFEPATVPTDAFSPNTPRNLALGLALGLMSGIVVALLRETLDTKIRDETDVAKVTRSSVVGTIAVRNQQRQGSGFLFVFDDPMGIQAEGMRRLRTNLQYVGLAEGVNSIVVTSPMPGEGKSTIAVNLALTMADSGVRTLLVDADLRRPSVAEYLGLEGSVGLTTVLIGRASLDEAVQAWGPSGLSVLPSGGLPPNPSELLASRSMADLLVTLTQQYEFVIFDSPPVQPVTDAVVLSKEAGGVLMVVSSRKTHQAQLRKSLEALRQVGAPTLGIVLNRVVRGDGRDAYHSYSSDSGQRDGRRRARRAASPEDLEDLVDPVAGESVPSPAARFQA